MGIYFIGLLIFVALIFISHKFAKSKKSSIILMNIDDNLLPETEILKKEIEKNFLEGYSLIILQDDIMFFDKDFYWPKGYAYAHLSIMNMLAKNHIVFITSNEYKIIKKEILNHAILNHTVIS